MSAADPRGTQTGKIPKVHYFPCDAQLSEKRVLQFVDTGNYMVR